MIAVEIHDQEDVCLARVYMREAPRVGEFLWLQGKAGDRLRAERGSSSFTVTEVAHWVGEEWSPSTHQGDPVHSICVYVRPTAKSDEAMPGDGVLVSRAEADLARQWFNSVEDTNPAYLGDADRAFGLKLHDVLGVYASEKLRNAVRDVP